MVGQPTGDEQSGEGPDPQPGEQQRDRHDPGVGGRIDGREEHRHAAEHRQQPEPRDPAGGGLRKEARDSDGRGQQRDRERQDADTGLQRAEPERHRQEQRDREEQAGLDEVEHEEHQQPARHLPVPEQRRLDQRLPAARLQPGLPLEEHPGHQQPGQDEPDRRRQSEQGRRARLRHHPAPLRRAQDPEDGRAETGGREHRTQDVEPDPRLRRRVLHAPGEGQDADDDEHLADEHPAPREVRRRDPADEGADGDRDRARPHDEAVGPGSARRREVPRRRGRRSPAGSERRRPPRAPTIR